MSQLGEFLRSRRARISPSDAGLKVYGKRRRVAGLRREEVAQLAGVSVDYYVRLEQGRGGNASDSVLDAIAQVLRLDAAETAHLRDLVRPPRSSSPAVQEGIRNSVRDLLDNISLPAFVIDRCLDVMAWNSPANALHGFADMPAEERNMARHALSGPVRRDFYPDWEAVMADIIAYLRLEVARHPDDARLAAFIDELTATDPDFQRLWAEHAVREKVYGTKRLHHPLLGTFEVGYETLTLPGDVDRMLVVYTAPPDSVAAAKAFQELTAMAAWAPSVNPPP